MNIKESQFINLTEDNINSEHLCCIIRSRKPHKGVEEKRKWLSERIKDGHVFRKLDAKATVFIEYAPLEKAWVPVTGDNFYYIYCLWVMGEYKGKGYGRTLLEYCIEDARRNGKSGICMLGSERQKAWLTDQSFAKKHGFKIVDETEEGYQLLSLSFDGSNPKITDNAKKEAISGKELTIFYDMQCPYVLQFIDATKTYCNDNSIPLVLNKIDTLEKAKSLPCVFNNYAIFYNGKLKTINIADTNYIKRIVSK